MAKKLIYAVFIGHTPGIYTSYDEAEKQVKGFPNNKYLSFSNRSEAVEWLREMNKKAQQEKRELEEGRELHRMKEEAAQKQRESELNEAPDLLRQTGGEAGTMESLFDQADRRAFVVDHRRTSHDQSDAGPSSRSTDGSPTSLEGTEASRGVEDQVADHASSQDIGLELRPQKKLKLSHEANSNAGKGSAPPTTTPRPSSNRSLSFKKIQWMIQRVEGVKPMLSNEQAAHLRSVIDMTELVLGRFAYM